MKTIVIRKVSDIEGIPASIERIRLRYLTYRLALYLLKRCLKLEQIILTRTAGRDSNNEALGLLRSQGISIIYVRGGGGRPVKFSRSDLSKFIGMRKKGASYEEVAEKFNLSNSTVARALRGRTKFCRWNEDYHGEGKVVWIETRDADPEARRLADNHYSRKTKGSKYFCGPGEKLVLITPDKKALFIWRKNKVRWDGQDGIECALFRNEGAGISSELIKEAVKLAQKRWPRERLFTYVRPDAIKSTDPGFCFKKSGWEVIGTNKGRRKLLILEYRTRSTKRSI